MKIPLRHRLQYAILIAITGLAGFVLVPRRYEVPPWKPISGTRYLRCSDGSRIAFHQLGPESPAGRYPIIFLQGGPGGYISERTLQILRPLGSAGFRVLAYDPIGSGSSSRLASIRGYTVDRHLSDLHTIIESSNAERVILIGQSWGGILASLYTARHPERIAGLILTGPGPLPQHDPGLKDLTAPDSLGLRAPAFSNREANRQAANIRTRFSSWLALHFGIRLMPDAEADAFGATLNRLLAKSTYCDTALAPKIATPGNGYYAQLMTIQSLARVPDPRPALRTISAPVLILKGQCDNQPWGYTQEYAILFRNSRLVVIPGAGHNIPAENSGAYTREILRFLASPAFGK